MCRQRGPANACRVQSVGTHPSRVYTWTVPSAAALARDGRARQSENEFLDLSERMIRLARSSAVRVLARDTPAVFGQGSMRLVEFGVKGFLALDVLAVQLF